MSLEHKQKGFKFLCLAEAPLMNSSTSAQPSKLITQQRSRALKAREQKACRWVVGMTAPSNLKRLTARKKQGAWVLFISVLASFRCKKEYMAAYFVARRLKQATRDCHRTCTTCCLLNQASCSGNTLYNAHFPAAHHGG
jgi:hypothetical protein